MGDGNSLKLEVVQLRLMLGPSAIVCKFSEISEMWQQRPEPIRPAKAANKTKLPLASDALAVSGHQPTHPPKPARDDSNMSATFRPFQ